MGTARGPRSIRRAAERGQVDAAECARRHEGGHRHAEAADHADAASSASAARPEDRRSSSTRPGIHAARSPLNRRMVETARSALADAEVALLVLDASAGIAPATASSPPTWRRRAMPTVVVLNKMDRLPRPQLLPLMAEVGDAASGTRGGAGQRVAWRERRLGARGRDRRAAGRAAALSRRTSSPPSRRACWPRSWCASRYSWRRATRCPTARRRSSSDSRSGPTRTSPSSPPPSW